MSKDVKARFEILKMMHELVINMNNENAYMSWIYLVPDEATEEDFMDIAEDESDFDEVCHMFNVLVRKYGKDGYCIGSKTYGATS